MRKVITAGDFNPHFRRERITGVSLTVPDMTMSLRDQYQRHINGQSVKTFNPESYGQPTIPDGLADLVPVNFEHLDKTARADLSRKIGDFVRTSRGKLITRNEALRRLEYEKGIIDRWQKSQEVATSGSSGEAAKASADDKVKQDAKAATK